MGARPAYLLAWAALGGAFFAVLSPSARPWISLGAGVAFVLVAPRLAPRRGISLAILAFVAAFAWARAATATASEANLRGRSSFPVRLLVLDAPDRRGVARVRIQRAAGAAARLDARIALDTGVDVRAGDRIEAVCAFRGNRLAPLTPPRLARPESSWRRFFANARARFGARIDRLFPRTGGFLRAVILGERDLVAGPLSETLRATGTFHLLAVSGLNLAFLVASGWFLLRPLPRVARDLLLLAAVAGYALLVEGGASVSRAAVAAAIFLLGDLVGRPADARNAWGAGALAALLYDPLAVRDAGFVLSYGGVLALLHYPVTARPYWAPFVGSVAVESALAPIVAARFGVVAPWAALANGLLVPTMGLWYPLACLSLAAPPLAPYVENLVVAWLAGVRALAELPSATIAAPPLAPHLAGLYAAAWLLAPVAEAPRAVRVALVAAVLAAGGAAWAEGRKPTGAREILVVAGASRGASTRSDSGSAGVVFRGRFATGGETRAEILVARRLPDPLTLRAVAPRVIILDEPPATPPPGIRVLATGDGPVRIRFLPDGRIGVRAPVRHPP